MLWLLSFFLTIFASHAVETHFSGFGSVEEQYYPAELPDPTRQYDTILSLQPELDIKYNKMSHMHFKPLIHANVSTKEKPEALNFNLQEAYWEIKSHPVRVLVGENTYNWGVLDGYSTQDIINGRTLYNPLSTDKRGAPTVDLKYEGDSVQVQALYIPFQSRTLLPSADSRWMPREVILNTQNATDEPITFLLPKKFNYYFPGYTELNNALSNNFGARISGRLNDFDLAMMYFEGSSTLPQMGLIAHGNVLSQTPAPNIVQIDSDVGVKPVYYRQRAVGASVVWAPSDIIVKLESTYIRSISDQPSLSPWSWQNGLGIERPWNVGSSTLTTILQLYYGKNEDPAENMVSSTGRLFDRAALAAARWSLTADSNLLLSYLYDYDGGSSYARFSYDRKFTDSFKAELSGDLISGDRGTLLGTYDKNDRIMLKISYLW